MRDALADVANKSEKLIGLAAGETVLDIGCNDGTLLVSYRTPGIYKVGFDPAENLVPFCRKVANKVVGDYFSSESYFSDTELRTRKPKIITSIAMFYDLEDPKKFVSDVKKVLDPEGLWVIQMSYLPLMLQQNAFDNICHEHIEYYSLHSLENLLIMYDLKVVDVELNDVNGGSFRVYIRNRSAREENPGNPKYRKMANKRVEKMQEQEIKMRLSEMGPYKEFSKRVDHLKEIIVSFLKEQVHSGKIIYVYGASTKGNTLLQYFNLDCTLITAAAERNPDKWGKWTVGTHIPIVSEGEARAAKPDYFLVLPWHFLNEFIERERNFLIQGGKFIVPLPEFRVIGKEALV
jgi:SAM-dependent methyltransferase